MGPPEGPKPPRPDRRDRPAGPRGGGRKGPRGRGGPPPPPPPKRRGERPARPREEGIERLLKGIRIVHEDEHLLVVDKPPGMATVPRSGPKRRGKKGPRPTRGDETAWLAIKRFLRERSRQGGQEGELPELRVVNDLDPLASGLLVVAKGESFEPLREQRSRGKLGRIGYVLVRGQPRMGRAEAVALEGTVRVEERVGTARGGKRNPRSGSTMPARPRSIAFRLLEGGEQYCLLRMRLPRDETWIVHRAVEGLGCQIARVAMGPARGPEQRPRQRLMLHLGEVTLEHPATHTRERYTTPPPETFLRLVRGRPGGESERRGLERRAGGGSERGDEPQRGASDG